MVYYFELLLCTLDIYISIFFHHIELKNVLWQLRYVSNSKVFGTYVCSFFVFLCTDRAVSVGQE